MHRVKFQGCLGFVLICISPSASVASALAIASSAPVATPVNATAITGVYNGSYRCARGPVNLKLTLVAPGDGSLAGVFTFDLPANSRTRTASYTLSGTYDAATGKFRLDPVEWEPPAPPGFVMVGVDGVFNFSAEQVSGKITGGYGACTTFDATRNKAQSAALSRHLAVTPASPAARTAQQPPSSSTTGTTRPTVTNSSPMPQSQDPRFVNSKDYCANNQVLSALFDCSCFAQSALDYYIKHPDEGQGESVTIVNIVYELDVRHCVLEDKVIKWAKDTANSHGATQIADCIGRTMVQNLRTKPEMGDISRAGYNDAVTACSNTTAAARQSGPAQTQKQQGGGWWWYCQAGRYMTGVFFYPADLSTRADVDAAIRTAWGYHITKEYPHENLSAGCFLGGTDQPSTQRFHDHMRASSKDIIDVDWKYVPGQDTPPPAPVGPTPVASGKGDPSYCFGGRGGDMYFSDIFEVPPDTGREDDHRQDYRFGFARFVVKKYGLDPGRDGGGTWDGGVMCVCKKKTFTECRSDKDQNEQYNREKSHGGFKIIETGWNGSGRLGP
jgi:hypothetical protein